MPLIIGLLFGLAVLVAGYELLPLRRAPVEAQLRLVAGVEEETIPLGQALVLPLAGLLRQVLPGATLGSLERRLFWAHFQGQWLGWTGAMVYALIVALAGGGALFGLLVMGDVIFAFVFGLLGALLPISQLRKASEKALREIQRSLPDLSDRLALEVVGGTTVEAALRAVAGDYPGLLGEFLRRAQREAETKGGRFLDVLRPRAEETGMAELMALFVKLAEIERQGVDAGRRLLGLSQDTFRTYLTTAKGRVRSLGGKMTPVLLVFFVLPFLALVVGPILLSVLALFSGM